MHQKSQHEVSKCPATATYGWAHFGIAPREIRPCDPLRCPPASQCRLEGDTRSLPLISCRARAFLHAPDFNAA